MSEDIKSDELDTTADEALNESATDVVDEAKLAEEEVVEAEKEAVELLGLDSRPVFIQSDKVEINPTNIIVASNNFMESEAYYKCYPDPENDINDGYAHLIGGGIVSDIEVGMIKKHIGPLSNLITATKDGEVLRKMAISKNKPLLNGSTMVGEDAVLAITSSLGLGGKIKVPLVNSGFTIELTKFTGDDWTILDEQLLLNKGEFGRITVGSSMSHMSSYLKRDIISAILKHICGHNLAFVNQNEPNKLTKYISTRDYETLLVAVLYGSLPDGLPTNIPCMSVDTNCNAITTGKTNAARMFYVDHGKLTDYQLETITQPMTELLSKEDYDKYHKEFKSDTSEFKFTRDEVEYVFTYKSPSLEDDINSGMSWASGINKAINRYITSKDDYVTRKRYINKTINTNTLAQFGGWFESIELFSTDDGSKLLRIEDQDTILKTLKSLYSDESVSDALTSIREFIHNPNPTTIGVPTFICPSCKKTAEPDSEVIIIPVDIQSLFFIHLIDRDMLQNHIEQLDMIGS